MKTGDIWLAQLDPTVGSEIQKTRPCVVISPDDMNAHLRTVIVAPMTTGSRPDTNTRPCAAGQAIGRASPGHSGRDAADFAGHVRAMN